MKISKVFLYDEPTVPEIKIEDLAEFIRKNFHVEVEIRQNIFSFFKSWRQKVAHELASCRVLDTKNPFKRHNPTIDEIEFEERTLEEPFRSTNIIMYDGFEFQNIILNLLPNTEISQELFHIVCTSKLTCTYDFDDYRYHGRAVICSNPAIISTTGIIEAPAKPREYYLNLVANMAKGLDVKKVINQFKGRYLEYNDVRLSDTIKGYAMQALFYYSTGEPFCDSKNCRLFNAHWQEDLLYSQVNVGKLCDKHKKILETF